ncbi:MAG: DNA-processing protein DprA [Nitrospira sp.]|nr:DNA-processing protein DprA [Nitrospira sp.]
MASRKRSPPRFHSNPDMSVVSSTVLIRQDSPRYPSSLFKQLEDSAPAELSALGNLDILQQKTLALFCSVKCPGDLILKTYDLAQQLREAEVTVIGGFHSPMERECLTILLRGNQHLIVCPARSLKDMRLPSAYKKPLDQGRLLLLSPFLEKERRHTVELASRRNQFVVTLATAVFVSYAEPAGKTEALCHQVLQWGKPLYTHRSALNPNLISMGAVPLDSVPDL